MHVAVPSLRHRLGELSIPLTWARGRQAWRGIADAAVRDGKGGGGRPVLVLPGFLAHDARTLTLRRTLARAGYHALGWECGVNRGFHASLFDDLRRCLDRFATDRPVALVGWSLGGVYARELAKIAPERVERVVTLGTPFSGDMRANHAWRLYERVAGHPVDRPPIEADIAAKPPVPTIALWSARDGIVAPAAERGRVGERDRAIAVDCTHMGFVIAPAALAAVLDALAIDVVNQDA